MIHEFVFILMLLLRKITTFNILQLFNVIVGQVLDSALQCLKKFTNL